jgi:hypothetical protein
MKDITTLEKERKLFRRSKKWLAYKEAINKRCHGICEYCCLRKMESVHHRIECRLNSDYENPHVGDLMGVCKDCHNFIHDGKSLNSISLKFHSGSLALSGDKGFSTLDEPPGHWII